jgi:hypothetical protein
MNARPFQLLLATTLLLVGCEAVELPEEDPSTTPAQMTTATADTDTVPKAEPQKKAEPKTTPADVATTDSPQTESPSTESDSAEDTSPAAETVSSRQKAAAGAGKKGQGYGGGPISEPARLYFSIRERSVFQIQIPQALNLYKATNGKGPADHDEFMAKIIGENGISLPELPAGKQYVFDPEQGELMIERTE